MPHNSTRKSGYSSMRHDRDDLLHQAIGLRRPDVSEAAKGQRTAETKSSRKEIHQHLQNHSCGYGSKLGTPKLWMVNTKLD